MLDCSQLYKCLESSKERSLLWLIDEVDLAHVRNAYGFERKDDASEVASENFRYSSLVQAFIRLFRVDSEAFARTLASSTASPLRRWVLRYGGDLKRIYPSCVFERPLFYQSTIHHIFHAWYSDWCFCNVCAENNFALVSRYGLKYFILFMWRQVCIETHDDTIHRFLQ